MHVPGMYSRCVASCITEMGKTKSSKSVKASEKKMAGKGARQEEGSEMDTHTYRMDTDSELSGLGEQGKGHGLSYQEGVEADGQPQSHAHGGVGMGVNSS